MNKPEQLHAILDAVKSGELSVDEAVARLRNLPYEDIGFAKIDHHRSLRTGFPEAVFCQGKSPEQVADIVTRLAEHNPVVLATRADEDAFAAVKRALPNAVYHEAARMIVIRNAKSSARA
ncbi:MAG: 1-(5-phosphoribosyl)-5-amino-4-imidazole-carboxylate carboxylase, partial [Armatimonadetes bacterium]|nr:1-(5-phosphoribosyl)-5-amino-4-imidazole-carboxylate carboxylase [Armatimonadota bacterium]